MLRLTGLIVTSYSTASVLILPLTLNSDLGVVDDSYVYNVPVSPELTHRIALCGRIISSHGSGGSRGRTDALLMSEMAKMHDDRPPGSSDITCKYYHSSQTSVVQRLPQEHFDRE